MVATTGLVMVQRSCHICPKDAPKRANEKAKGELPVGMEGFDMA